MYRILSCTLTICKKIPSFKVGLTCSQFRTKLDNLLFSAANYCYFFPTSISLVDNGHDVVQVQRSKLIFRLKKTSKCVNLAFKIEEMGPRKTFKNVFFLLPYLHLKQCFKGGEPFQNF